MTAKRSEEDWDKLFKFIADRIDDYTYKEIGDELGLAAGTIAHYVVRGKIKRTRYPMKSRIREGTNHKPVVIMDYDLNVVKRCKSIRHMGRVLYYGPHVKGGGGMCPKFRKRLDKGLVLKVRDNLVVLEKFWNEEGNYNFSRVAKNLLSPAVKARMIQDHIAVLDENFKLIEVFTGTVKDFEEREGLVGRQFNRTSKASLAGLEKIIMTKSLFRVIRKKRFLYYKDYLEIADDLKKALPKNMSKAVSTSDPNYAAFKNIDSVLRKMKKK